MAYGAIKSDADFGFHYTPYNFDSNPEMSFFEQMLRDMDENPDEVEDIYFTGALTDPGKTDFSVEYKDGDGRWRRYTPDFVIRRKDGKTLIVEIKREHDREHPIDGQDGLKALALGAGKASTQTACSTRWYLQAVPQCPMTGLRKREPS